MRKIMDKKIILLALINVILLLFSGLSIADSLQNEKHISTIYQTWELNPLDHNDTTPPVTTYSLNGTKGENGYYISDVGVSLNATDDISGVNVTYYFKDEGGTKIYTSPFWFRGQGGHVVCYYSVDNAGNAEDWKCKYIDIDLNPPWIVLSYDLTSQGYKFTASADDSMSGVDRVEFYYNYELMFTDYEYPYEWDSDLKVGGWITAIVFDRAGHQDESSIWIKNSRISIQQSIHPLFLQSLLLERHLNPFY